MAQAAPVPIRIQARQPGDLAGTLRFTNTGGGFDKFLAQETYREELEPMYFEAQNIDHWSRRGEWCLTPRIIQIGATEGADHEYLEVTFNQAVYKFPMVTGVAADIQKVTQPSGVPAYAAIANPYPGLFPFRGYVVWKDQIVLASAEQGAQALRTMSKTEVWGVIAAAAPAPTTANAIQVGVGPDDKLLVWFQDNGLYSYDGAAWLKVFPTVAGSAPVEGVFCDMIRRGTGSTIFVTRDTSDIAIIYEYSIEAQGPLFIAHLEEFGMRVWPDGLDVFNGAAWIGTRFGSRGNRGILFRKEKLAGLQPIVVIDTNLQGGLANDGRGLDWGIRCVRAFGDVLYFGASSREDHAPCIYRVSEDENGSIVHPAYVATGLQGPVYSIAMLPPSAAGAFGTERIFLSTASRLHYKDMDDGPDPTLDADTGFVQFPDITYGAEDRLKTMRFIEGNLKKKSTGGTVEFQYRRDPDSPSAIWASFGFIDAAGPPPKHIHMNDDNEPAGVYGFNFRTLQIRMRFTRATSGATRDRCDTIALDVVQMRPPGNT
jgi:hypothetical protein